MHKESAIGSGALRFFWANCRGYSLPGKSARSFAGLLRPTKLHAEGGRRSHNRGATSMKSRREEAERRPSAIVATAARG
jgi:hypothetical protein